MKIVIGSDHNGSKIKSEIIEYLKENGYINDENYVDRYIKNVLRLKECFCQFAK